MRNRNEIAEDVLSWATTPEHANIVLGDMLEAQPGLVEFWFAVVRATASLATHQPQRAVRAFLWFMYEPAFLALVLTLLTGGRHVLAPHLLGPVLIGVICVCYWILWFQKREPSSVTAVWFWLELLKCCGLATLPMVLLLLFNPLFWWVHWQKYQRKRAVNLAGRA